MPTIRNVSGQTNIFWGPRSLWQSGKAHAAAAEMQSPGRRSQSYTRWGGNTGRDGSMLPMYPRRRDRSYGKMNDVICMRWQ